jgi:DNA polymerase (family 10)
VSAASAVIRCLRTLADLADVRGADVDARDLRRAADTFSHVSSAAVTDMVRRARRDGLQGYPGIPATSHELIRAFMAGGAMAVGPWQAGLPSLYSRLLGDGVIDSTEASTLVRHRGILTLSELQTALDEGSIAPLGAIGLEPRLQQASHALERERRPIPLGRARDVLDSLASEMLSTARIDLATPAGDVRRFESLVSGLVIVARASDPQSALEAICALRSVDEVRHRSGGRALLCLHQAEVDVRVAAPGEYGTVLFHATGSPAHVRAIRGRRGAAPLSAREEDVYARAELPFIAPELRQGSGELEAAAGGRLPSLIAQTHVRGDLRRAQGSDTPTSRSRIIRSAPRRHARCRGQTSHASATRSMRSANCIPRWRFCTASRSISCRMAAWIFPIASWNRSISCSRLCTIRHATMRKG